MHRLSGRQTITAMSRHQQPALTIDSGEVIRCEIREGGGVTGPVYVSGAEPGDALVVEIRRVKVSGGAGLSEGLAVLPGGVLVAVRPSVGVIGTAPSGDPAPVETAGEHGGFLACRRLRAQARIYLPVAVPGALLALGGLHAAMGDGVLDGAGVAVSGSVEIGVRIVRGFDYPLPLAVESGAAMFFASAGTVDEAVSCAAGKLKRFLSAALGVGDADAVKIAGAAGHLRLCQVGRPPATARAEVSLALMAEHGVIL